MSVGRLLPGAPAPTDDLDRDLALLVEYVSWAKLAGDDSEMTDTLERTLVTLVTRLDSPTPLQQYLLDHLRGEG